MEQLINSITQTDLHTQDALHKVQFSRKSCELLAIKSHMAHTAVKMLPSTARSDNRSLLTEIDGRLKEVLAFVKGSSNRNALTRFLIPQMAKHQLQTLETELTHLTEQMVARAKAAAEAAARLQATRQNSAGSSSSSNGRLGRPHHLHQGTSTSRTPSATPPLPKTAVNFSNPTQDVLNAILYDEQAADGEIQNTPTYNKMRTHMTSQTNSFSGRVNNKDVAGTIKSYWRSGHYLHSLCGVLQPIAHLPYHPLALDDGHSINGVPKTDIALAQLFLGHYNRLVSQQHEFALQWYIAAHNNRNRQATLLLARYYLEGIKNSDGTDYCVRDVEMGLYYMQLGLNGYDNELLHALGGGSILEDAFLTRDMATL